MSKIGVITYAHRHLKTEQFILSKLRMTKDLEIAIFALPFFERKPRDILFSHRPDQNQGIHPYDLCSGLGLEYVECENDCDITNECDYYIITGAGILSKEALEGKKIINCHPGIIPAVRGLDSFKWAIYNNQPLGNTLHYIDSNPDMGQIISVVATPIFDSDTLESLARRHYEYEIDILSNFQFYLDNPVNGFRNIAESEPTRRMDAKKETEMLKMFEEYKERSAGINER